ncbi:hypothetical protein [Caenispirillum bisanense]|uniref:hypothetical protein n=1 Tax=Caenispirillum bisanense TaxID=414052 RepID=UPI0031D3751E
MGDLVHFRHPDVSTLTANCMAIRSNMAVVTDHLQLVVEALRAAEQAVADALEEAADRRVLRQRAEHALDSGDIALMEEVRAELDLSVKARLRLRAAAALS